MRELYLNLPWSILAEDVSTTSGIVIDWNSYLIVGAHEDIVLLVLWEPGCEGLQKPNMLISSMEGNHTYSLYLQEAAISNGPCWEDGILEDGWTHMQNIRLHGVREGVEEKTCFWELQWWEAATAVKRWRAAFAREEEGSRERVLSSYAERNFLGIARRLMRIHRKRVYIIVSLSKPYN